MKSYLEKKNFRYFTFSLNYENPIKAVTRYLPADIAAVDNSNSLEDLGFHVINLRQMTAT
jgi:hypothetical protein